ncbi:unnamed protein product [Rhizophagus irregularis]|nr:unnamed protein product [Rhizophagus irregularis]
MIYPDETYPERHYPDTTFFPNQMMKNVNIRNKLRKIIFYTESIIFRKPISEKNARETKDTLYYDLFCVTLVPLLSYLLRLLSYTIIQIFAKLI